MTYLFLTKTQDEKEHNNQPHHPPHCICKDCHEQLLTNFSKYGRFFASFARSQITPDRFLIIILVVFAPVSLKVQIGDIRRPTV